MYIKRFFSAIILIVLPVWVLAQTSEVLVVTRESINKATKADDLYHLRMNLNQHSKKSDLSEQEWGDLGECYRLLSGGFARFNHYKNAVEAYGTYLNIAAERINNRRDFEVDSLQKAQAAVSRKELTETADLERSKQKLIERRNKLETVQQNYFTWGAVGAVAVLSFFFISLVKINKKIIATNNQLGNTVSEVRSLFDSSLTDKLKQGIPDYLKQYISRTSETIRQLNAPTGNQGTAKSLSGNESFRNSLKLALDKFEEAAKLFR
ncbi:MAG TPA: hypothetical protein VFW78_11435 [Bacteroidia bacterium]|nr:hypothetical protein [Bacteroidia bacterium]